jgi:hypothetical protein
MMINKGEYTIVALMENPNLNLGSPKASYTVQLLNRGGTVIGERTGTTFINPNEKFVVFEPNFTVGSDTPTRAFISFASIDNWQKPAVDKAVLTVVRRDFSTTTAPTLRVSLNNTSVYDLAEVLVPVVISDQAGNAISASATFVDNLTAGASREVNFTWREPFTAPPVFVDFYPRANNFLLH